MGQSNVAVVAVGQTELRPRWSDAQHIDLISAAVTSVFQGSGLSIDDVDFVIDSGSDVLDGRSISNCGFLGALGAHHKEEARVEDDGLWGVLYGVNKIRSGSSRIGLIVAYSKPSESDVELYWASQCEPFYQRPVGFGQRAALGIQAQRYLARTKVTDRDLAELVAKHWANASANGRVQVDKAPDAQAVLGSGEGAFPLSELMLARPVDGAVAMLIANEDVASRASRNPVFITGMGTAMDRHSFAERSPDVLEGCAGAAKMAYGAAGWKTPQADIAEISGASVVGELLAIEALGLAKTGAAHEAFAHGKTDINRSGGALPANPIMATGLVRLAEATRQLSGQQKTGAAASKRAIVHGSSGVAMQNNAVFTLEV